MTLQRLLQREMSSLSQLAGSLQDFNILKIHPQQGRPLHLGANDLFVEVPLRHRQNQILAQLGGVQDLHMTKGRDRAAAQESPLTQSRYASDEISTSILSSYRR